MTSKTLVLLAVVHSVLAVWPFPQQRFTKNSLLEAGSLGLTSGTVVALGDFNGDQFLDAITIDSSRRQLTVQIWNHDRFQFEPSTTVQSPQYIQNVVPGDFNHDGITDLLVMCTSATSGFLDHMLYFGAGAGTFNLEPTHLPASTLAQPIPVDASGDLIIDLLGSVDHSGVLKLWRNSVHSTNAAPSNFQITDAPLYGDRCVISNPHSNAAVDLNGDCLADIFLTCGDGDNKYYQIWISDPTNGFSLERHGALPPGLQSLSFADMDRDGTIDIVFTTCSSVSSSTGLGTGCALNIAYNRQLPLCTNPQADPAKCRKLEELCTPDHNFHIDLSPSEITTIPISSLYPGNTKPPLLLALDTSVKPPLPVPIKLGDANLDGFPDILYITGSDPQGGVFGVGQKYSMTPQLAFSVPCSKSVAGCAGKSSRGFKVAKKGTESLDGITDAKAVAFLDIDEDGTLDVMVQRTGEQGLGTVLFVQNNYFFDAFFLKAVVLNGACNNGWCETKNSSEKYHPFGVSYSGATYKYTVLDTSGKRSAAQVVQLPQTSYQSLLTPYSFFGLGRTNNYIENLFVGSTKKNTSEYFINMEGVVPNSKVVIYPPPAGQEGAAWRRELYLRPGEWIPLVTLTVVVTAIVLLIIVFVLHLNEKREDELERRRGSHHINFDAL